MQAATIELLEELGAADRLIAQGRVLDQLRFTDAGRTLVRVVFDRIASRYRFALAVPQSTTERVLAERLAELGGTVERELEAESVQAVPGGYRVGGHHADGIPFAVTARFVVGADGAHSMVRSAMGLDFPGETYQQQFLLADIALTGRPCADNEAVICTSPRGVVVVGRIPNGTYRLVATMPPGARIPQHPDRAQIGRLLTERGIDAEPAADPVWASRFRVHHRAAARFRRGGLLLCGDAAHIHSPAAGQGMNTGMADAYDLAGRLAAVTSGAADPSVLDGYDQERRAAATAVLAFTDRMTRVASLRSAPARALRNLGLRTLTRIPAARAAITLQVTGLARSPLRHRTEQPLSPTVTRRIAWARSRST